MKIRNPFRVGAALCCLLSGLQGAAVAEPGGKTDIVEAEALTGVFTNVPKMFEQMHGQTIKRESRNAREALDLFCAGAAGLLATDKPITPEASEGCVVSSMTELRLGSYSFDVSLLTGQQRNSGDYDDLIARQEIPVLLYVNKDRAPKYKEFLDFITDETLIGDLGILSARGLTALPKDQQKALRLAARTLPDYVPATSAVSAATNAAATAATEVPTPHTTQAQVGGAQQSSGAAAPKRDAGSFSEFTLQGVQPFMTCDQVEKVLTGQGYQRLMRAGFVKSGSKRILLLSPTCSGDFVSGVSWQKGMMTPSACAAIVEPMLGGQGDCQDDGERMARGGPVKKRVCTWRNDAQSVEVKAKSDYPRSPTKPETSECWIEMSYP